MPVQLTYIELTNPNDQLFVPWLELYETAFPAEYRMLISKYVEILQQRARDVDSGERVIAAVDAQGKLVALHHHRLCYDLDLAVAWYLAVVPERRNQGIGMQVHDTVAQMCEDEGLRALVFEVEHPDYVKGFEKIVTATKKIERYRRHGAKLLMGIDYTMCVGSHQPETPMHIMVQPFEEITPLEAYELVKSVFGDQVKWTGELRLE